MDVKEYIDKRLDAEQRWYSTKSKQAKKRYTVSQVIEIIVAALIPLLSGYAVDNSCIALVVGILGAIIAVIESISKLFKWHENWIQYRTTSELLKYHKHLYLTNSYPYNNAPENVDNLLIKNIEDIISSENNQWKINASNDFKQNSSS